MILINVDVNSPVAVGFTSLRTEGSEIGSVNDDLVFHNYLI